MMYSEIMDEIDGSKSCCWNDKLSDMENRCMAQIIRSGSLGVSARVIVNRLKADRRIEDVATAIESLIAKNMVRAFDAKKSYRGRTPKKFVAVANKGEA